MRPDMHKVIVERPRWTPGRSKKGRRSILPDELLPKFEGIKRPHRQHKGQRDLLGPLRRWLQSQVGRHWNDVYSEACMVIHPDNYVRVHVKTHLLEFVERHTFMRDGRVCIVAMDRSCRRVVMPITELHWGRSRFFVHPETGLLQAIPAISHRVWRARNPRPAETKHWVSGNVAIKQIRGLWFECHYETIHSSQWFDSYDHVLERIVTRQDVARTELLYQICTCKRQLSKRELRRHGLRNSPAHSLMGAQSSTGCPRCRLRTVLQISAGRRLWVIGTEHR